MPDARLVLIGLLATAACTSPDDSSGDMHLVLVQAPETVMPGSQSRYSLLVKVVNGDGTSVPGIPVTWSIKSGGGGLSVSADTSGVDGLATALWTPGPLAAPQQIGVSIYGQPAITITVAIDGFHADKVDAGYRAVCGLQGTSTWCWALGRNSDQTFRILSQVQAKTLALSDAYACVVDVAGATFCNIYYQYQPSSPDEYQSVAGLPPISAISSGDSYFCGIAIADATPWCWNSSLSAVQVSTTLHLRSITTGNFFACGLAEDGTSWCWSAGGTPALVPGGHTFREISAGSTSTCAIEAPARLYCWDQGQAPVLMPGASPGAIAMGFGLGVMNVQSGVRTFYVDPAEGRLTFLQHADFPFPATQISGDDTPCLIAVDGIVYCLGMYTDVDAFPTDWIAVPAPREVASAR